MDGPSETSDQSGTPARRRSATRLDPHEFGRRAERFAVAYLQQASYRIIAVNQRVGRGEIDVIASRSGVLVFVEVKARRTRACGAPEDAVTPRKCRQVARLASLWLSTHPRSLDGVKEVRFDILAVDATSHPVRVRHLEGAFDGQW
jgi:putative endonuclease